MRLTWLVGVIVIVWIAVWTAGNLLESRPRYRNVVQVLFILIAFLLIVSGFLNGVHRQTR